MKATNKIAQKFKSENKFDKALLVCIPAGILAAIVSMAIYIDSTRPNIDKQLKRAEKRYDSIVNAHDTKTEALFDKFYAALDSIDTQKMPSEERHAAIMQKYAEYVAKRNSEKEQYHTKIVKAIAELDSLSNLRHAAQSEQNTR